MDKFAQIDQAAHAGANGHNDSPAATQAQQDAGNYAKGRLVLHGLRIAIETPRGTRREWRADDGTSGSNLMKFHYGYIEGTLGADGDELDVSIGPLPEAPRAYVVNQYLRGKFDEHKVMLGFPDRRTAEAGYRSNYDAGWNGMESCISCSIAQLQWWVANGNMARPLTQDQLPYEGTDDTMDKVIWDSTHNPLRSTLDKVLYALRGHDAADGLLFDAVCMADILADADGLLKFDALVIPFARIEQRMALLRKVLDRAGDSVKVAAMQVSEPFTQRGSTSVAVVYELTDGQTVSVFFHNPDVTPKKIVAGDDLISWKWMLNKKDITVAVAPERGRDLDVRTVASRIMRLAVKNSARFIAANGKRAEKLQVISELKDELETKKGILSDLEQQIEVAQAAREAAGLGDPEPVALVEPEPTVEPVAAAPAPVLNIDGIKAVVTSGDPMPGVAIGAGWVVMNAPRPLMGTETQSNGEFLSGRFYAAIDPRDYMAQAYLDQNIKDDASVVFVADKATLTAMALQTVSPRYLAAYMEMEEDERDDAISGFMRKLNGKTYGALTELAAKGMPVVAAPEPVAVVAPITEPVVPLEPEQQAAPMLEPMAAVVPQPAPVMEPVNTAPTAVADITYRASDDMFTAFYPNTPAGEEAWKTIAADDGTGKVQNGHVESTIQQLRDAGYTVAEAEPNTAADDDLLAALTAPAPAPTPATDEVTVAAQQAAEMKDEDVAFLRKIIDGTHDLSDPGIPGDLGLMHKERSGDAEFMGLFKTAVKAYSSFAVAKANAALSK